MEDKIKKNKTKNRAVHLYVELCEYTEQIRKTRHGPFLEANLLLRVMDGWWSQLRGFVLYFIPFSESQEL